MLIPVNLLQFLETFIQLLVNLHLFLILNQPPQRIVSPQEINRYGFGEGVKR